MDKINWGLVAAFGFAGLIEMALPLVIAVVLARRLKVRWRFFWIGVLTFLFSQGITRVPAMLALQSWPAFQEALKSPVSFWSFLAFAAVTAGLFEETGRWIAFRYAVAPQDRQWRNAVMFGTGHGGLESFGIGCLVLVGLVNYFVLNLLPADLLGAQQSQIEAAKAQFANLQGWEPLLGAWERLFTLPIHMAFSVMVLFAFLRGFRWWWIAFLAHAVVDFAAVGTLQLATKTWGSSIALFATEGLVGVMGAAALCFVIYARRMLVEVDFPTPTSDK
jgi:uncharacterized membrane protein YhfC